MRMRLTFIELKKRKQSITHVTHRNDKSRVAPKWEYNSYVLHKHLARLRECSAHWV